MSLEGLRAAVIGGGVGGLAAALALAQRRAEVVVYEQAPALGEVGAGLQLGPNAVAVLEALGLRDAVEAKASLPEAIELREHARGGLLARLPLGAAAAARWGRPYWHVHRADLVEALAGGLVEAGVTLRAGARAVAIDDEGASVRIGFADGSEARADIAVAADGMRSATRSALFGGAAPAYAGVAAWRALVSAGRLPAGLLPRAACVFLGPGRHVVAYPVRRGALWNLVAVEERPEPAAEDWDVRDDPARMRRGFAGWCGAVSTLLAAADRPFLWGLYAHPPLPAWTKGRIALLGDACHPMLPFLAQGAAMALEDAWVLGAALAGAHGDAPAGLRAYEDLRRDRATRVQAASAANRRIWHIATPGLREGLHLGLRLASAAAPGRLIGRYDWLYGANVVGPHAQG